MGEGADKDKLRTVRKTLRHRALRKKAVVRRRKTPKM